MQTSDVLVAFAVGARGFSGLAPKSGERTLAINDTSVGDNIDGVMGGERVGPGDFNPCERVRDYYCKKARTDLDCTTYQGITDESLNGSSNEIRASIKAQCTAKIQQLEEGKGVDFR